MSVQVRWQVVRGEELTEAFRSASLRDIVPDRSAVYLWKRNLRNVNLFKTDPEGLVDWLEAQLVVPNGRVVQQRVGHFISLTTVELKAQSLALAKRSLLRKFVQTPVNRQWLASFLEQMAQHAPALYVGETGNMRKRADAHLRGDSDFGHDLLSSQDLTWEALDLYYFDLGPSNEDPSEIRKTIEYITTAFTIGGYTRRPG